MRARITPVVALVLLPFVVRAPLAAEETLLLLARHAEKEAETGNPDLSPRGLERAEALAGVAESWRARAVYATDFCRTAQTALPLARRLGVPIVVQRSGSPAAGLDGCSPPISAPVFFLDPVDRSAEGLLRWVLEQHAGQAVLIVGHSNTVPEMLSALGVGEFEIADDQYDRLFLVTYDSERGARVVERSYGERETPAAAAPTAVDRVEIVDRAIELHGGDLYRDSRTRLTISSRSGSFRLDVRRDGGLFEYLVEDVRDGQSRVTRVTNDDTEQRIGGALQVLDGDAIEGARSFAFARVYFPFLPFGLNDPGVFKIDQGLEEWDGRLLHRVRVTFAAGSSSSAADDYAYWFDPETARLEQYAYSFGTGTPTGGLRFRRLSNYRRVGGILFFDADNAGFDADGDYSVDLIDPAYVARHMEPVSEVKLSDIRVEPLTD
ncbi:MAG: histidine phosphatase family protein [Acidobacteriota bacterium]|nr:histidine phosphatase family protein [Acidobacteriota bacterium]MDH3523685.1 histidine phosphatase family protein [Acidobacteriota bacterium]